MIHHLKHEAPSIPILVLTLYDVGTHAAAAFRAGARGFLNKSASSEQLIAAIHCVALGRPFVDPAVADELVIESQFSDAPLPYAALSDREREVFACLPAGNSVKQMAARMDISVKTVSTYKARLLEKMGMSTVSQLVQYGIEHHLLDT